MLLWIRKIVASVSNRPLSDIAVEDKLADLGFDSLMFVELQAAVEDAGGRVISPDTLNEVQIGSRAADRGATRRQIQRNSPTSRRAEEKKDEEEIVHPVDRPPCRQRGGQSCDRHALRERPRYPDRGRIERAAARQFHRRTESHVAYRHRSW